MNEGLLFLQGEDERKIGIHYEVDLNKKLGEGGMGRVYFGYRIDENRGIRNEVAVKFLYGNLTTEEIGRARREASIQLRNDNLVEMYGLVEIQSTDPSGNPIRRLHVVSEYLNGVTLQDLMNGIVVDKFGNPIKKAQEFHKQYEKKREKFAVNVLKNVLSGILALHDAGYIHRDIDPSNIMLTDDGRIKLIDFGVAHKIIDLKSDTPTVGGTMVGTFIGKPAYAAPEIVEGAVGIHNETTDIYALGILLFQLLTGHLPFTGSQIDVLHAQVNAPLPLDEIEDDRLRKIIKKATEKEQSERYSSAAEFRVALDKYPSNPLKKVSESQADITSKTIVDPYQPSYGSNPSLDQSSNPTIIHTGSTNKPQTTKGGRNGSAVNNSENIENKTVVGNNTPHYSSNSASNHSNSNTWWSWWYFIAAVAGIAAGCIISFSGVF